MYGSRYDKPTLAARCCCVANDFTNFTGDRRTDEQTNTQTDGQHHRVKHRYCKHGLTTRISTLQLNPFIVPISVLIHPPLTSLILNATLIRWSIVWPHNPATRFRPPSATMVSAEPFSHGTGTLRCLQKEMATYRHWSVSLWRDPDNVSHYRILSPDKTEWRLISATLCGWGRCFVADQLWLMTRIREEDRR